MTCTTPVPKGFYTLFWLFYRWIQIEYGGDKKFQSNIDAIVIIYF